MSGRRISLTGNERLYISYWLDRALLEATEFAEVSAISSLKHRISNGRNRRPQAITVRPTERSPKCERAEQPT